MAFASHLSLHIPQMIKELIVGGNFYTPEAISGGSSGELVWQHSSEKLGSGNEDLQRVCMSAGWARCHVQAF